MKRVQVKAGVSEHVSLTLDARDLSSVDEQGDRRVAAGEYRLSVGGGQPGGAKVAFAEAGFVVRGEMKLPE